MPLSSSSLLLNIAQEIVTYMGLCIIVFGVLGNLLNILVFLSLQTFRQSSCAFYLTIMSAVNIGQLIWGELSRVMITGFGIDWMQKSLFYCKFRWFAIQVCGYMSFTCMCLATIDQFLATCVGVYWQQWSNIKLAQRLIVVSIILWIVYDIPYLIFYQLTVSPVTGEIVCMPPNRIFWQYSVYMNNIVLTGGLPIFIAVLFGSLAFRNVRQIAYRTVPLVRRELDKQLTNMVLVLVIFSFFFVTPYFIAAVLPAATNLDSNPATSTQLSAAILIAACVYYLYFACPFYIYICVSERFRQQFIYVLFHNRCQRNFNNQILAHPA